MNSRKASLVIPGLTALVCSRAYFAFLNDPEGPNLLIVVVLAAILYGVSWGLVQAFGSSMKASKKLWVTVLIQVLAAAALTLVLN